MKNLKSMYLFLLLNAITLFGSANIFAQISGKVVDAQTNETLPYVNIEVKNTDGKTLTGTVTDNNGVFEVKDAPNGTLSVVLSFIGYHSITKSVTISAQQKRVHLGTLKIEEDREALEEVELVAERTTVEQKIDRKVVHVGKDLTSVGATASEILNNVQSVSVDSQTGQISLRGNDNVRVLVDGKPSNISPDQLLKQIPSTSIKTVELITNPSAKYNPEGMSGIINIILHKNAALGFNGSVNAGLTYGLNPRYNLASNMNLKKGKVNFYANYGLRSGKSENFGYVIRDDNSIRQDFDFDDQYEKHLLKAGADYYINEKNTLSFYTTINTFDEVHDADAVISGDIESDSPSANKVVGNSKDFNLGYTLDFDKKGEKLEIEALYAVFDKTQDTDFNELVRTYDLTRNYVDDVIDDRSRGQYNIDYTNPLTEKSKLEVGLEYRFHQLDNEIISTQNRFVYDNDNNQIPETITVDGQSIDWFQTEAVGNSDFDFRRELYSAYVNYNHKFDKLNVQIGARLEDYNVEATYTQSDEDIDFKDHILTVYPSAFLTYKANKKNQFQFSYSRRVDRPSKHQVNPIRQWSTPLLTSVGNPSLRPQFTNSFEVNYTYQYKKGSINASTFLRLVSDNITRVLNVDEFDPDRLELSFTNSDTSTRYGFEISSNHKFSNWWRMNASADLYLQEESGFANNELIEVQNNAFNFRVNNNFTLSKKLRLQLFGMYRGRNKSIQFDSDPMWMINTGASYKVFKGKGRFTLNLNDIFNAMQYKFDSDKPIPQQGKFRWETRTVFVGFMYNFGNGKNKARKRKRRESNDSRTGEGLI